MTADAPAMGSLDAAGLSAATALGRHLLGRATEAAPSPGASGVVIGAACDDPLGTALEALERGRPVLVEPIARCGLTGLRSIAAAANERGLVAAAAFRRRLEPELAWARGSVAAGAIGLPWGAHAEALSAASPDALTEALDLLDAVLSASGLRCSGAVRLGAQDETAPSSGAPIVLSLAFDHGALGQVIARIATTGSEEAPAPELATFRITGSHGTIHGDLDGPALERHAPGAPAHARGAVRVDPSGTRRLVEAFAAAVAGRAPADLVGVGHAADLLALIEPATRT